MTSTRQPHRAAIPLLALGGLIGALGLLGAGCTAQPEPRTPAAEPPSGAACCEIWGEVHDPDTVRLEFGGVGEGRWKGAVVYGDGVVITDRVREHRVDPGVVAALLEVVEASGFRDMEETYGEGFRRVRSSVDLTLGEYHKQVVRLLAGTDPEPVTALVETLLGELRPKLGEGVGATSLEEALRLVAEGTLSHRELRLTFLHRPAKEEEDGEPASWFVSVHDGWIEAEPRAGSPDRRRLVRRSGTEGAIRDLAATLVAVDAWGLPANLHSPQYTQLSLEALRHRHTVLAREFARRDPAAQAAERARLEELTADLLELQREMLSEPAGN